MTDAKRGLRRPRPSWLLTEQARLIQRVAGVAGVKEGVKVERERKERERVERKDKDEGEARPRKRQQLVLTQEQDQPPARDRAAALSLGTIVKGNSTRKTMQVTDATLQANL